MTRRISSSALGGWIVVGLLVSFLAAAAPASAGVGTTLLFWGSAAVDYPYGQGPLLRSEVLTGTKYLVTGKVNLVNKSTSALDVTCTTSLNTGANLERVSVPPTRNDVTGRLALLMECVAANGSTAQTQRAELTCTCASGALCSSLSFEGLGIIAESIADDSDNIQVQSAPGT